jgi:IS30 family transposase
MASVYVHLSLAERCLIETQLRSGFRPSLIASGLGRSRSTVTREMLRNGWRTQPASGKGGRLVAGGYRSMKADRRARRLAKKPRVERMLGPQTSPWADVAG